VKLVGDRQTEQVRNQRAVKGREQRGRHEGAELGGVGHVRKHLHHADQRADHAERRGAVADGAVDLAALIEVHQEVVAVALKVVANEFHVVAVGDVTDSLGKERFVGLDLFQTDRSLFAGDFGNTGQFVHEVARREPAHREREFRTERQAVQHHAEGKADHGGGDRAAKDDDDGMFRDEHVQIAAHEHHRGDDNNAEQESGACHNIHGRLQPLRERPAVLDDRAAPSEPRNSNPKGRPLKTRKG
jgi:hypothetical protein